MSLLGSSNLASKERNSAEKKAFTLSPTSLHSHSMQVFLTIGPVRKLPLFSSRSHVFLYGQILSACISSNPRGNAPLTSCTLKALQDRHSPIVVVNLQVSDNTRVSINTTMNTQSPVSSLHICVYVPQTNLNEAHNKGGGQFVAPTYSPC